MKLYTNQADNYIKSMKTGSAVLIYGPDGGAVKDFTRKIANKINADGDPMGIKEFDGGSIKDDPGALLSEINAMNFFATERIITISDFVVGSLDTVMEALTNIPGDLTIIITADELGKDSKLRKFFESHKSFPVIPCYKDDERAIRTIISQKFREAGVAVDSDAMNYLATNLGEDKGITNNEIEKILTYLGDEKRLTLDDVCALLADSSELTMNDIAFSLLLRDTKKLEKSLSRAFAEQISSIMIFRSVLWQFQRLASVRAMVKSGMALESAVSSLRPMIFIKQVEQFKSATRKWDGRQLLNAIEEVTRAELDAKSLGLGDDLTCRDALLKLAVA